jgi:conjugative transposon TraK protein
MFASLRNIDTAFQQTKTLIWAALAFSCATNIGVAYYSYKTVSKSNNQIYLLNGDQLVTANAHDSRADRTVEAKAHVKQFHEYFFTLDPDQKAIESNINKALFLADNSAKREYNNLKEKGFYSELISASISMEIQVDSVVLSKTRPYTAITYANQTLTRATSLSRKRLVSECTLRDVTRSENNSHGFIIENWHVTQNVTLSTSNR